MSYRTDYRSRQLKSSMKKTLGFSSGVVRHYMWDDSLGPYGTTGPKIRRQLKQLGNKKLRAQHKATLHAALRQHHEDMRLDWIDEAREMYGMWLDWDDHYFFEDDEQDFQAQEDARNDIWDDDDYYPRDTRHDLVQHHHLGLTIQELVRIKGLQLQLQY